jgi:hypothetical protein
MENFAKNPKCQRKLKTKINLVVQKKARNFALAFEKQRNKQKQL